MKRVAVFVSPEVLGGPHMQAMRTNAHLRESGWHQIVVVGAGPGNAFRFLRDRGVDVRRMNYSRPRKARLGLFLFLRDALGEVVKIVRFLKAENVNVVQAVGLFALQPIIAATIAGIPVTWHITSTMAGQGVRSIVANVFSGFVQIVQITGDETARMHAFIGKRRRAKVRVYWPPVDVDLLSTIRSKSFPNFRHTFSISPKAFVVLTAASINPNKAQDRIVDVAKYIAAMHPEKEIVFALAGPRDAAHQDFASRLDAEVEREGLSASIRFLGVQDIGEMLRIADCSLLVSKSEGFPTFWLESWVAGVPCVATAVGGLRDPKIHPDARRLLVDEYSRQAVADQLCNIMNDLRDPQIYKAVAIAVSQKCSLEDFMHDQIAIYNDLAAGVSRK